MFVIGLLSGILLSIFIGKVILSKMLFIENKSKYNFEETQALINSETTGNEWAMPHQYDLQATMKKNGFNVRPVTVYSICKPILANQILGSNNERIVSSMMPCRIAIYQKNNGKTYVSRINANILSKLMSGRTKWVMSEAGKGSEKILERIIK